MRRYLGAGLVFVLALPVWAAKPNPKGKPAAPAAAPLDGSKLGHSLYTGKLVSVPDADRNFVLEISYQQVQLKNPKGVRRNNPQVQHLLRMEQQLVRLEQQMARSRNPVNQLRRIQQLATQIQQQQARYALSLYKVATVRKDIEFQAAEDLKVRQKKLPSDFDDKGNIKKYTPEELKELKGPNPNLPGYTADLPDLTPGQIVQVTLGRHKAATTATTPSKSKVDKTDKEEKDDKDPKTEKKIQARMIVILRDGDEPPPAARKPRRGKK